jgi:hypothetical protein
MKNKIKYQPPKLFAIHNEQAEGAICAVGSNATNMCNNGFSANEGCWSGPSAQIECDIGTGVI